MKDWAAGATASVLDVMHSICSARFAYVLVSPDLKSSGVLVSLGNFPSKKFMMVFNSVVFFPLRTGFVFSSDGIGAHTKGKEKPAVVSGPEAAGLVSRQSICTQIPQKFRS